MRFDGRSFDELRKVTATKDYLKDVEGAVLIEFGHTKVICTATIEEKVPPFLKGKEQGWITAEYGMLPRSSEFRIRRSTSNGRTHEIQRLIGRSLRTIVDMKLLGERTITIDCDVIQADGGTRTASITGGFIAMADAINKLIEKGTIKENPIKTAVAAVSVGIHNGNHVLDLPYEEDSTAEVDMNVVMDAKGRFIEVQGTAEGEPFSDEDLSNMLSLAKKGIMELVEMQGNMLGTSFK